MLRAVIIDDEKPSLQLLNRLLEARSDVSVLGAYSMPSELLQNVAALQPDAAFLDIEMPGMNGLELAERLLELSPDTEIVFVTAYKKYAFEAFDVSAVDYLLKPVHPDTLGRAVGRLLNKRKRTTGEARAAETPPSIACLGDLRVTGPGGAVPLKFPTAKTEELFAFLLVYRDKNAAKWTLCDNLWPEFAPEKAEQNLHTTAFRLKKALKDHRIEAELKSQRGYYRLDVKLPSDYEEFVSLLKQGEQGAAGAPSPEQWKRAVALYRGQLFGARDYAWCELERERLRRHYAAVSKNLARHYLEVRDLPAAADVLLQAVEKVPYDEEGHEMLLRILWRMGDRASFLAHYVKLERLLREELGVEPNSTVRSIYAEIRQ